MDHVIAKIFQLHADHSHTNSGCFLNCHVKSATLWWWQDMEVRLFIRIFVGIVVRVVIRLVIRIVGKIVRTISCARTFDFVVTSLFIQSQKEFALFDLAIVSILSRASARPCFIMTFCPSLINEGIKVVFPAEVKFFVCFVIVIYFDVADFREGWVIHMYKLLFTLLIKFCKESYEEVLRLI